VNPITLVLAAVCALIGIGLGWLINPCLSEPLILVELIIAISLKMTNVLRKFVVLRAAPGARDVHW
jgi:F0F1-type ATP synthase assembly protein I